MRLLAFALLASLAMVSSALSEDFALTIKDHRFEPAELQVPAESGADTHGHQR